MEVVVGLGILYMSYNTAEKIIRKGDYRSAIEVSSNLERAPLERGEEIPYPIRSGMRYQTPLRKV